MIKPLISWEDFEKIDLRIGTIITVELFPEAHNPSYKLKIDFGSLGIKKTSAQITKRYQPNHLIGLQVTAVVNFPPKQIANFMSECLVIGAVNKEDVILIQPNQKSLNGLTIG